jgi:DNA adenine methylase
MVGKLLPLVPEHRVYVEVFAGGASLLFAKEVASLDVLNDVDSGVVNFYRVLRDPEKFKRFHQLVSLTPFSREEYCLFKATWQDCEDDVERAYRWFVMVRQCYGGIIGSGFGGATTEGRRGMALNHASYLSAIDRLPEISERLMRVQIEHEDFREILKRYDGPETFFYLDPPYVSDTRNTKKLYTNEMSNQDHEELIESLLKLKGKAMLSGYATPIYGALECAGWVRHEFSAYCSAGPKKGPGAERIDRTRTEIVWIRA